MDKKTFANASKIFHEKIYESIWDSSVEGLGEEIGSCFNKRLPKMGDVLRHIYYKEYGLYVNDVEKSEYVRSPESIKEAFYDAMKDTEVIYPGLIPNPEPFVKFVAVCEYVYDQYKCEQNNTRDLAYDSGFYSYVVERYEDLCDNSLTKAVLKEAQTNLQDKANEAYVASLLEGRDVLSHEDLLHSIVVFELSALVQGKKEATKAKELLDRLNILFAYYDNKGDLDENVLKEIREINKIISNEQKSFGTLLVECQNDYEKRKGKPAPKDVELYRDAGIDGGHFNAAKNGKRTATALMLFAVCIGLEVDEEQAFRLFRECKDTKELESYNICNAVLCHCIREQRWDINYFIDNVMYYLLKGEEIEIDLPKYLSNKELIDRFNHIKKDIKK